MNNFFKNPPGIDGYEEVKRILDEAKDHGRQIVIISVKDRGDTAEAQCLSFGENHIIGQAIGDFLFKNEELLKVALFYIGQLFLLNKN